MHIEWLRNGIQGLTNTEVSSSNLADKHAYHLLHVGPQISNMYSLWYIFYMNCTSDEFVRTSGQNFISHFHYNLFISFRHFLGQQWSNRIIPYPIIKIKNKIIKNNIQIFYKLLDHIVPSQTFNLTKESI